MNFIKSLIIIFSLLPAQLFAATFSIQPLSEKFRHQLTQEKMWREGCPVSLDRLNLLTVSYYDFSGHQKIGQLIVFDAAAPFLLNAFKKMYEIHYPLENISPLEDEGSGFEKTAAFNCRPIVGENKFSVHSYGLAIDINILRNLYLGEFHPDEKGNIFGQIIPTSETSYHYLNRAVKRPGMNERIVKIMADSGFIVWGGRMAGQS